MKILAMGGDIIGDEEDCQGMAAPGQLIMRCGYFNVREIEISHRWFQCPDQGNLLSFIKLVTVPWDLSPSLHTAGHEGRATETPQIKGRYQKYQRVAWTWN